MNLKRLKSLIKDLDDKLHAHTEEVVGRNREDSDEVKFEHHLVIFDPKTKRVILKANLNKNQVYRTNGTGFYKEKI
jgi:hypothetical protein